MAPGATHKTTLRHASPMDLGIISTYRNSGLMAIHLDSISGSYDTTQDKRPTLATSTTRRASKSQGRGAAHIIAEFADSGLMPLLPRRGHQRPS